MRLGKNRRGFTLIELLVVIAIIGLLATIVLVSLNTARQKARDARRVSDLRQISIALEMYYDSQTYYPGDTAAAGCNDWGDASSAGTLVYALQTDGYMTSVPNDPSGGTNTYYYEGWMPAGATTSQKYVLMAILEACSATSGPCATDVDTNPIGGCNCLDSNRGYCLAP